jgi:hypothetical protein
LGSLAWGLGEVDCVYHVNANALFGATIRAEQELGGSVAQSRSASRELRALLTSARVRDLSMLFDDLFGEYLP